MVLCRYNATIITGPTSGMTDDEDDEKCAIAGFKIMVLIEICEIESETGC